MYDYIIVGSGLFGAIFAHEAMKAGKTCLVLEKRDHIGGNCYTETVENIQVHRYGAHIFHTSNKEVWDYMQQFGEMNHYVNSPIANFHGETYNMPFNMNTFSKMWGISTPAQAKEIIQKQSQEIQGEPQNLEEHVIKMVGRDVYEKLVKGYTEKQWGRPCNQLPTSIIKRLPVRFTYDNNYFNDPYQGIPKEGYTNMIAKMLDGADILLNTDFLENRESWMAKGKTVIYTGTIDSYFNHCYGPLEYRAVRFEHDLREEENYQGVAVVNYTDGDTPYTRMIEHKHFVFGTQPKTVVSKEYPMEWQPGDEPYYPINDEKNQSLFQKYQELAKQEPIIFGGRLGEYRYYDMKDIVLAAWALAKNQLK